MFLNLFLRNLEPACGTFFDVVGNARSRGSVGGLGRGRDPRVLSDQGTLSAPGVSSTSSTVRKPAGWSTCQAVGADVPGLA